MRLRIVPKKIHPSRVLKSREVILVRPDEVSSPPDTNNSLLLEGGDALLMESGDNLLTEDAS